MALLGLRVIKAPNMLLHAYLGSLIISLFHPVGLLRFVSLTRRRNSSRIDSVNKQRDAMHTEAR